MIEATNAFLDSLSPESRLSLIRASRFVDLPFGTPLFDSAVPSRYVYFLTSGIAFSVVVMSDGRGAEVGMVGREGVVGLLQPLGPALCPIQSMMQISGKGLRIPVDTFRRAFANCADVHARVLELVQANALLTLQIAGCHALHQIEPRLARWLLMVVDRTGMDVLLFTQEFLAYMLGARRTTVTMVAKAMQQRGFIHYSRGRMRIVDRAALEKTACSCYQVSKGLHGGLYASPMQASVRTTLA